MLGDDLGSLGYASYIIRAHNATKNVMQVLGKRGYKWRSTHVSSKGRKYFCSSVECCILGRAFLLLTPDILLRIFRCYCYRGGDWLFAL
ncbi:hypothetical protein [Anaplasma platys]|uniref:hypothetical protein n=1 Tax=Anaplasma platys TaxID=949 RepID=UPI00145E72CA|nr:hypothetical protein [Anaplasma platys]